MQATPTCALRERWRRCSLISAGPVAQLRPITSTPSGSSAVRAAPISEPISIVPVVSTVTLTRIGNFTPASAMARFAPTMAALDWSRSWHVSTWKASTPPRIIAAACVW